MNRGIIQEGDKFVKLPEAYVKGNNVRQKEDRGSGYVGVQGVRR